MNYHTHLPLSFRLTPRRCPRNRESAALTAARKRHRRVCATFILLVTLGPVALIGLYKIMSEDVMKQAGGLVFQDYGLLNRSLGGAADVLRKLNPDPPFEMEVPESLQPILRKHGAVKYKTHPSGLAAVFDAKESLWFFYESPAAGQWSCTGSSSRFSN